MEKSTSEMKGSDKALIVFAVVVPIIGAIGIVWQQRTKPVPAQTFMIAQYLCLHNEKVKELGRGWSDTDWVIKCNNGAEFNNVTIEKVNPGECIGKPEQSSKADSSQSNLPC